MERGKKEWLSNAGAPHYREALRPTGKGVGKQGSGRRARDLARHWAGRADEWCVLLLAGNPTHAGGQLAWVTGPRHMDEGTARGKAADLGLLGEAAVACPLADRGRVLADLNRRREGFADAPPPAQPGA